MAELRITIELDNAVFEPEPGPEVARILVYLSGLAWGQYQDLAVRDVNGNNVGRVEITG